MSQSGGGVTHAQLQQEIANAKSQLRGEFQSEIKRLMSEISAMARQVERAIETQTAAIIAGVAATTAAVVSTKSEISDTRNQLSEKLTLQLRSELQLELGRKLNVARSASAKFKQFYQDIRSRFEKSVEGVFINRTEYDERFNQIFEEYENKVRTIGEHIFQIRDEIRLVESSCSQSLETIYSLPMEVDLYRLDIRSQELDETVSLLEASRLLEIKSSLDNLKTAASQLSYPRALPKNERAGFEAIYIGSSTGDQDLMLAAKAVRNPGQSVSVDTGTIDSDDSILSPEILSTVIETLSKRQIQPLREEEYQELRDAVKTLIDDGIISPDDAAMATAVIESRKISQYV